MGSENMDRRNVNLHIQKLDAREIQKYRPITLLGIIYKIWGIVTINRLTPILNFPTYDARGAYKKGRPDLSLIQNNIKNANANGLILLGLSEAIGALYRDLLWATLRRQGLPWELIRQIMIGRNGTMIQTENSWVIKNPAKNSKGAPGGSPIVATISAIYRDNMLGEYDAELAMGHRKDTTVMRKGWGSIKWKRYTKATKTGRKETEILYAPCKKPQDCYHALRQACIF